MRPDAIGLGEAAERLGVHYMTAYRYIRTGRLRAEKVGAQWEVDSDDVARLATAPLGPRPRPPRRAAARARLEDRLLAGDELGAWHVIETAMASGAEPADVHTDLLVPALRSIGDRWAAGELSVGDEHRAVAAARRVLGRLSPRFNRRGRKRGTVILGAVPGERHELPVTIVADHLRAAGYEVVDFGADTPTEAFAAAAAAHRPMAVLLAVTCEEHRPSVGVVARAVHEVCQVPVLVGGAGVRDTADAKLLGADDWTGRDVGGAVRAVEAISAAGSPASAGTASAGTASAGTASAGTASAGTASVGTGPDGSATDRPATDRPATDRPATDRPVTDGPAGGGRVSEPARQARPRSRSAPR